MSQEWLGVEWVEAGKKLLTVDAAEPRSDIFNHFLLLCLFSFGEEKICELSVIVNFFINYYMMKKSAEKKIV